MIDVVLNEFLNSLNKKKNNLPLVKLINAHNISKEANQPQNNILVSMINFSKEKITDGYSFQENEKSFLKTKDPILFNLDLIVCCNFSDEKILEGLASFSEVIATLNENPTFPIFLEEGKKQNQISIKISGSNSSLCDLFWSRSQISYLPSIICNLSTIIIHSNNIQDPIKRIESYSYEVNR